MKLSVSNLFSYIFISTFFGAFLFFGSVFALEVKDECNEKSDIDYDLCLGENHFLKDGKIYWTNWSDFEMELLDVDLNSFDEITESYAKDSERVYWRANEILEADPISFEIIGGRYDKFSNDDDYVFYFGKVINGADPSTFRLINETSESSDGKLNLYSADQNNVYIGTEILSDADPESFEYIKDYYFKDKNNVYLQGNLVEGADPNSFTILRFGYAKDKDNVYLYERTIEEADPETFYFHPGSRFANDVNFVYYSGEKIKGSDGSTFEFVVPGYGYAKDKNQVYRGIHSGPDENGNVLVEGADSETFENLMDGYYFDKNNVYFLHGKLVPGADPESFGEVEGSKGIYYFDRNNVYRLGEALEGSDPGTFELLFFGKQSNAYYLPKNMYSKDSKNVYFNTMAINADSESFKIIGTYDKKTGYGVQYYAKDKDNAYYNELEFEVDNLDSLKLVGPYLSDETSYYYHNSKIANIGVDDLWSQGILKANGKVFFYGEEFDVSDYESYRPLSFADDLIENVWIDSLDSEYFYYRGERVHLNSENVTTPFNDTYKEPYELSIQKLKDLGVIQGYPGGYFGYSREINRAEFLKIVFESRGMEISADSFSNCFPDVGEQWFAGYVCYGKEIGVVNGYGDGFFRPEDSVTYSEALKILFEAFDMNVEEFGDVEWFQKYMKQAQDNGFHIGSKPSKNLYRGEMAELVVRFMEYGR